MNTRYFLNMVLMIMLTGISLNAFGEELVEKMEIKPVHKEGAAASVETQVDIRTSKVIMKQIPLGHAMVLAFPLPFSHASVANPAVADSLILSPTQLYLSGKEIGYTTLTLWDKEKNYRPFWNWSFIFPSKPSVITCQHCFLRKRISSLPRLMNISC